MTRPRARTVAAAAVLLAAAIFSWRTSGAVAGLLHACQVHATLLAPPPPRAGGVLCLLAGQRVHQRQHFGEVVFQLLGPAGQVGGLMPAWLAQRCACALDGALLGGGQS